LRLEKHAFPQRWYPAAQRKMQAPPMQAAVPWGSRGHWVHEAPHASTESSGTHASPHL
jgi:hypothetical protein